MENEQNYKSKKLFFIKIAFYGILSIVFLGLASSSFYFYHQYKKVKVAKTESAHDEISTLTDEIRKFMDLPEETPTLATVADENKIKDQPFFAKAQNGDKVLIYANAQKAILYRPATKKIIEVFNFSGLPKKEEVQDNQKNETETEEANEKE